MRKLKHRTSQWGRRILRPCLGVLLTAGVATGSATLGAPSVTSATPSMSAVALQEFVSDHLNGRTWNTYNLTQGALGPPVLGAPSALWDSATRLAHVYLESAAQDLTEFVDSGAHGRLWNAYDLSAAADGGGPVSGAPDVVYTAGLIHLYVRAFDGDLTEYVDSGAHGYLWNAYDLSAAADGGGKVASSAGSVVGAGGLIHVYVQAADGDLTEYVDSGAHGYLWNAYDLSAAADGGGPVTGAPSALCIGEEGVIHVYVEGPSDLMEYVADHLHGGVWSAYDLSVDAGGGTFVTGTPTALFVSEQSIVHVYARGADNDLMEYAADHRGGRIWNAYDLSSATGGPAIGTNSAALDVSGVVHVYVGGPVPMGGTVIFNAFDVPDAGYPSGGKVVALTFDDGPSPLYTPQILGILEAYRVPASFEIIGSEGATYPSLLTQEAADGFALVNHTWNHVDLTTTNPAGWVAQVDRTDALLSSVTHRPVDCLRPPYGYTDSAVVSQLAVRGLAELMWDVDPSDYLQPGASVIAARVLAALHPGAVVILHDGGGDRSQTVAALPSIITGARAAGYRFVEVCG